MNLSGEQQVAAPRQRVWEALNDPEVLRQCIPGCQSLEKEGDDRFNAVAEVKIGPIGARFRGTVQLSDLDAPNGYTITGQGNGGIAGNAKGGAKVRLSDADGGTLVSYDVEAEVGGRMAQLGGPIIDATAKQMAGKFFAKFGEVVSGGVPAAAPAPGAAPVPAEARVAAVAPVAAPAAAAPAAFPWGWVIVTVLAIVAGFLLGRSAVADWWVVAVAALAVVCVAAGYQSGKGGRT